MPSLLISFLFFLFLFVREGEETTLKCSCWQNDVTRYIQEADDDNDDEEIDKNENKITSTTRLYLPDLPVASS